jgi:hypothetical protein
MKKKLIDVALPLLKINDVSVPDKMLAVGPQPLGSK